VRPDESLSYTLEAHHDAATLYVTGTLSTAGVIAAMHACEQLPDRVRALRVDLRGTSGAEPAAFDALAFTTRRWRDVRGGSTRIDLPRSRAPRAA
jgi:ABC-type transporter Mla MlaB component